MPRRRRRRLTPLEREQTKFRRRILSIFRMMDIDHLRTKNKRIIIGGQEGELDYVFLFENLIILCEDTVGQTDRDHLRTKNFFLDILIDNKNVFIDWLKQEFSDKFTKYRNYSYGRYKLFFIYAHKSAIDSDTKRLFPNFKFLNEYDLRYFDKISKILKKTSRNDFYKFLNLELSDIGPSASSENENNIETAVILPEESSGFPEGVKVISFLVSAKDLLDCSYVLRKESV